MAVVKYPKRKYTKMSNGIFTSEKLLTQLTFEFLKIESSIEKRIHNDR